jgi:hypothetical protein
MTLILRVHCRLPLIASFGPISANLFDKFNDLSFGIHHYTHSFFISAKAFSHPYQSNS